MEDGSPVALPEEPWLPLSPLPYEGGDSALFKPRIKATIEKLPHDVLTLIFNELAWTSLANVMFASDTFTDAAFDSAALRSSRPVSDVPTSPVPVSVPVIVVGADEPEVVALKTDSELEIVDTNHRAKRKRDELLDLNGEVVRVVHQKLLQSSPAEEAAAKRQRLQYPGDEVVERADTPGHIMVPQFFTNQQYHPYQQQDYGFVNQPLMTFQQQHMPMAQYQYQGYVQQPATFHNFGLQQQQGMVWNNSIMLPTDEYAHVSQAWAQQPFPPGLQHLYQRAGWDEWGHQW